jgi:hypothetical protein
MFHAWTTVIQLELWGQTPAPGAASYLWRYRYTIVGMLFPEENVERGEPARDRSRWPICSVATVCG